MVQFCSCSDVAKAAMYVNQTLLQLSVVYWEVAILAICSSTGPSRCMKPVLRSTVPSLCPLHLQKAEKHVTRALRKAGLNVTSTSQLAPKYHVVVAEFVRQIQSKRRAARKAIVDTPEGKEGKTI
ncbi:hypothetical protein Acr_24g0005310 [Actinidia rufa]|uniref:Uncharacterized protein n=1 Tax=Actinidia rufa TaxID=165716 RepID=A0A7J0GUD0_9ERIC|nr:hypothetical protein Acr_24g0005310 [Actinidia rufa]